MTLTTVLNCIMLAVGPVAATFVALDTGNKEGGQDTAIRAALFNLGCIVLKLTIIAFIVPIFSYSSALDSYS